MAVWSSFKIGHMNSIMAAGHLNIQVVVKGAERLLIKGRSYKVTREEEDIGR